MEVKDTKKKDSEDVLSVGPDFSIQNLLLGPFQHYDDSRPVIRCVLTLQTILPFSFLFHKITRRKGRKESERLCGHRLGTVSFIFGITMMDSSSSLWRHLYVYAYYHDISNLNIWCVLLDPTLDGKYYSLALKWEIFYNSCSIQSFVHIMHSGRNGSWRCPFLIFQKEKESVTP